MVKSRLIYFLVCLTLVLSLAGGFWLLKPLSWPLILRPLLQLHPRLRPQPHPWLHSCTFTDSRRNTYSHSTLTRIGNGCSVIH